MLALPAAFRQRPVFAVYPLTPNLQSPRHPSCQNKPMLLQYSDTGFITRIDIRRNGLKTLLLEKVLKHS
jgi:hypothetical protein